MEMKKGKTNNCNWCTENQQEMKALNKEIKSLETRISELQQDMECCSCQHVQQTQNIKTEPCCSQDNASSTSMISSTSAIKIKAEKVEPEEESLSDARGTNNIKIEPEETQQQLSIIKQEKVEPMLSDDDDDDEQDTEDDQNDPCNAPPPATTSTDFTYYCIKHYKCPASFSSFPTMLQHLVEAHGWKKKEYAPFCGTCGQLFMTKRAKLLHCRVEHGVACQLCNGKFKSEANYLHHMKYEHKSAPPAATFHSCSVCGAKTESKAELISHVIKTHGFTDKEQRQLVWTCAPCKSHFLSQDELETHDRKKHRFECRSCGAIYTVRNSLTKHRVAEHGFNPPPVREGPVRPPGQGLSKAKKKRLKNIKKAEKKAKKQQYRQKTK